MAAGPAMVAHVLDMVKETGGRRATRRVLSAVAGITLVAVGVPPAAGAGTASTLSVAEVAGLIAPDASAQVTMSASAQSLLAAHGIPVDRSTPVATILGTGDPFRAQQWGLAAIQAPDAGTITNGAGVTVAIVDSGVSAVADLSGKVLSGADFIASGNGTNDQNGHGTGVASIVAATVDNGVGLAGVAPAVKILPVRVCDARGACPVDAVAAGIIWAVDHGAQVLNASLGGAHTPALAAAVAYAESHNVSIAGSVGNSAESGNPVLYPGGYDTVIGVAAVDNSLAKASFSETGPQVDVAAPGVGIVQAAPGNKYVFGSGTSQASPHVAAVAALAKSYKYSLTPAQIRDAITSNATDLGAAGRDDQFGAGLLNAAKSLTSLGATIGVAAPAPATALPVVSSVSPAGGSTQGGTTVTINGTGFDTLNRADPNAVTFGGAPAASFTITSATRIVAVAPAGGNGPAVIKATNQKGSSVNTNAKFTYRAPLGATFTDLTPVKATGGSVVTVAVTGATVGANQAAFTAEKITAKVGGVAATVSYADATHLRITAPATTKAVATTVQLFHDGVAGPVSTSQVAYAPVVTSVGPRKVSTTGGTSVTITGTGFLGLDPSNPGAVTFAGTPATSFVVKSATQIIAVAPPGTNGTAQVTVTTTGGGSANSTGGQISYRSALGLAVPAGAVAKAGGGSTLTLEVTGGTIGNNAKEFAAEGISVLAGATKLAAGWVDATHLKVTIPAATTSVINLSVVHDTIPGAATPLTIVPVVTGLSAAYDSVAGGKKVTVRIAGGDISGATGFTFGGKPAACTAAGKGTAVTWTCTVPAASQAGPTWVSFTASNGLTSRYTAASTFSYTDIG